MVEKEGDIDRIKELYKKRIQKELGEKPVEIDENAIFSSEYLQFKDENTPSHFGFYEKACNASEKILQIAPDEKQKKVLQEAIEQIHLNITPTGVLSFAIFFPLVLAVVSSLLFYVVFQSAFMAGFAVLVSVIMIMPLANIPNLLATDWRMRASNQMVISIFYLVTFMRHTSNLEGAIKFASEHLAPPLSLDFKLILWNVETGKYESTKESLDAYLIKWKDYAPEFIEAFHLIESSLYESDDLRRVELLEKSLDIILSETYEKMLHFAHELKSPITTLHMLGVIMPILGLVLLPLMVSFLDSIRWYHIGAVYNIFIPLLVWYYGLNIMSKRPSGYGDTDISKSSEEYRKMQYSALKFGSKTIYVSPIVIALPVILFFALIGIAPLLIHAVDPVFDYPLGGFKLLDYKAVEGRVGLIGPFGLGATVMSVFIIVGIGMGLGMYYKIRSAKLIKVRDETKRLEREFSSAIFQLGNRLGDGIPAEIAFGKVAETMSDTVSGKFFSLVNMNIRKLGMSVEKAIFDPKYGAIVAFPSNLIRSSMQVLTQGSKKGPKIASKALVNISTYIKEMHRVDERLRDLLSEVVSSIKGQINFMAPVIAGVVVGIAGMISSILGKLGERFAEMQGSMDISGGSLLSSFKAGIPTYYIVVVVGVYVVQLVWILSGIANEIANGKDNLSREFSYGNNLPKSTTTFVIVGLAVLIVFNLLAATVIDKTIPGT
ncbi:hypothetical protein K9M79_05695 [Candidatus Woesearchaeota archaeon]|nr:hypothetical protein [Candidatus Woesearchaeota archaeon]